MIQINNINFSQKTIESIQIDDDDVKRVEVELLDNKFKLTIIKNTIEIIKEEINDINIIHNEPKKEEPKQEEPNEEPKEEEPKDEEPEPKEPEEQPEPEPNETIDTVITLEKFKDILEAKIEKENTAKTYFRTVKDLYKHFKSNDMIDLLSKEEEIIDYLEQQYKLTSTLKNKLCGIYKCYSLLNIESKLLKDKIEHYRIAQSIKEDKSNHEDKKTIEEADTILTYFHNELDTMREKIKKDTDILNRWDTTAQLYTVLKIYLTYGMLRPSEIINMKITDTDEGNDKINYINVVSKKIVINNHKNDRNGPKIIDITDKQLSCILWKGLNKYLITSQNGEIYKDSSGFSKLFSKTFNNHTPYDLRKCISSKAIHDGDTERIKELEHNQGHSLDTILLYYNDYT